jgi:hypothetical protein
VTEAAPRRRWLTRNATGPVGAWAAFAVVHLTLALINLLDDVHVPFGDVVYVYRFWMDYAAEHGVLVGIDTTWVYPVGALLPMGFAYLFGPGPYGEMWLLLVTALDAVAFAVLLRRSPAAAWWWVAFLAALGPVAVGRIDAITAPLAMLGLLWLATRPLIAGALLALATWIKVWPAALLAAAVIALRRRAAVVSGAALLTAVVLAVALLLGTGANVLGFITEQGERGLQVEAPVSAFWLWQAALGVPGTRVYYDQQMLTYQVLGTGTRAVAAVMTPLLVVAVAAILLLGVRAVRRGVEATALLAPLSLALVLVLIVVNKVGSPQYIVWLAPPVLLGIVTSRPAVRAGGGLVLGIAAGTQIVYPWAYSWLIVADPVVAALLTARNLALIVLLVLTLRGLWSLPAGGAPAAADRSRGESRALLPEV